MNVEYALSVLNQDKHKIMGLLTNRHNSPKQETKLLNELYSLSFAIGVLETYLD